MQFVKTSNGVLMQVSAVDRNIRKHGGQHCIESRCGAVAVGVVCLLPPLSSGGALVALR